MVVDGWSFVGLTLLNAAACLLLPRLISLKGTTVVNNIQSDNASHLAESKAIPENI